MFVFVFPLFYSAAVSAEAAATHLRLSIATRLRAPPTNTPPSPTAKSPDAPRFPAAKKRPSEEAWRMPDRAGAPPLAQAWKREERLPR